MNEFFMKSNSKEQDPTSGSLFSRLPWDALFLSLKQDKRHHFKALLAKVILDLDEALSRQLSLVIQAASFKALEASWRGIEFLVSESASFRKVKLKILDWDWDAISRDLRYSFELKRTGLYRKIYSDEFDMAGGTPFGLLLVDHKIKSNDEEDVNSDDLYTVQLLSELAEVALCPAILGVDYCFWGDEPGHLFQDLSRIDRILKSSDFNSWALLREKPSSRFLSLVFPEYLVRSSYQHHCAGFLFNERPTHKNMLWGNAAYLLVANVIREFDRTNWFGFLTSYNASGSYGAIVQSQEPIVSRIDIHSEDDPFWRAHGFIPLSSVYLTHQKGFFSNQSVWRPSDKDSENEASLQTHLMACRFAHYIKAQIRDRIGRFETPDSALDVLKRWLQKYTSSSSHSTERAMAAYPLHSFQIKVEKINGDETKYQCEVILTLKYQSNLQNVQVFLSTPLNNKK